MDNNFKFEVFTLSLPLAGIKDCSSPQHIVVVMWVLEHMATSIVPFSFRPQNRA